MELNSIGGHMTPGADHMTSASGSAMIGLNLTSVLNANNSLILLNILIS